MKMKAKRSSPAATRQDILDLREATKMDLLHCKKELLADRQDFKKELLTAMKQGNQDLKTELIAATDQKDLMHRKEILGVFKRYKEEIIHYFGVKTEQLTHDYRGIFGDRTAQHTDHIQDHERRIRRVESSLGLVL